MLKNFRTYSLSVEFYKAAQGLSLPFHLKDQLRRAASSICLNLAEGSAKSSHHDQRRFHEIAMGSLRECQAILTLADRVPALEAQVDAIGAHLHKLIRSRE